jgi:hypothetical protein
MQELVAITSIILMVLLVALIWVGVDNIEDIVRSVKCRLNKHTYVVGRYDVNLKTGKKYKVCMICGKREGVDETK